MNIAIIDDLKADRETTSQLILDFFEEQKAALPNSIHAFESGEAFLNTFADNLFDLIFIDYYLGTMSGLDIAYAVREAGCEAVMIFTTASPDFAIDCYKVRASGYLVKPISQKDFSEILSITSLFKKGPAQFIEVTSRSRKIRLLLKDIIYCDIEGHYVQIHTKHLGIQTSRMTFAQLKSLLMPHPEFILCYRGSIINMDYVDHIEEIDFYLDTGERIPFRKKERNEIIKAYTEFLFNKVREHKS